MLQYPKKPEDCLKENDTAQKLYSISASIEKGGMILSVIVAILGIITVITNAIAAGAIDEDTVFGVVITTLFSWAIYTAVVFAATKIFAALIEGLAAIVQNTKATADAALLTAVGGNMPTAQEKNAVPEQPKSAPAAPEAPAKAEEAPKGTSPEGYVIPEVLANGRIKCPSCGREQNANRTVCYDCSQKFIVK